MALFAALTLLPVAVLTYAAVTLSGDALAREVRAKMRISATLEARAVANRMDGVRELVGSVAQGPSLIAALGNGRPRTRNLPALHDLMQRTLETDPGFSFAAVLDLSGQLISIAPPSTSITGQDLSYRDWCKRVTRTGRPTCPRHINP